MAEAFEREKLKQKIGQLLKNPYSMQLEEKKELGLNFASNIEDIQKLIIDTMHGIKGQ